MFDRTHLDRSFGLVNYIFYYRVGASPVVLMDPLPTFGPHRRDQYNVHTEKLHVPPDLALPFLSRRPHLLSSILPGLTLAAVASSLSAQTGGDAFSHFDGVGATHVSHRRQRLLPHAGSTACRRSSVSTAAGRRNSGSAAAGCRSSGSTATRAGQPAHLAGLHHHSSRLPPQRTVARAHGGALLAQPQPSSAGVAEEPRPAALPSAQTGNGGAKVGLPPLRSNLWRWVRSSLHFFQDP